MSSSAHSSFAGLLLLVACAAISGRAHAASWWYEQAERLQHVSATLLDGPPISEPVPAKGAFLGARSLISLLPKPNPKVGDKEEKVPAAPVHTVPTLVAGVPVISSGRYGLVLTAWAGYLPLPVSIAKSLGVNASLSQFTYGGSLENVVRLANLTLTTSAGAQLGKATLEGAITEEGAKDKFDTSNTLIHVGQGLRGNRMPLWGNVMLLVRRTNSVFAITKEKTEFKRVDTMADTKVPFATQVTVGATFARSFHLAVSEYIVPDRLIMPRVSLAYHYSFAKQDNASRMGNPAPRIEKKMSPIQKRRKNSKPSNRSPSTLVPESQGESGAEGQAFEATTLGSDET